MASLAESEVSVLALDVFGVAIDTKMAYRSDIHSLVAATLGRVAPEIESDYAALRVRAQSLASREAAIRGESAFNIYQISETLSQLLAQQELDPGLAKMAIQAELEYEQVMAQVNPTAADLIKEAVANQVPVAFVADSYLPRDLVAKLLNAVGLPSRHVLVSSHEGVTNENGDLIDRLVTRARVDPSELLYIGPSSNTTQAAEQAGVRSVAVEPHRQRQIKRLTEVDSWRSALDSVGLGLAADRLATISSPTIEDMAYYAGGPLMAGFGAWLGQMIDEQKPDRTIFCGELGWLLREVMLELRPSINPKSLHFWGSPGQTERLRPYRTPLPHDLLDVTGDIGDVAKLADIIGLQRGEHLIVAGTQLDGMSPIALANLIRASTNANPVQSATILAPANHGSNHNRSWAGDMDGVAPIERLTPAQQASLTRFLAGPTAQQPELVSQVCGFARELAKWIGIAPPVVTWAMMEPAVQLVAHPTASEIAAFVRSGIGPGSSPIDFELV